MQRKIGQPAPSKNGNEKLGNQFTVNGIPLKEITRLYGHCCHSLCLSKRLLTSQANELENEQYCVIDEKYI